MIVPVARVAAFTTWWTANIDPRGASVLSTELNASGDRTSATHAHCSGQFTEAEAATILRRLATIAGISLPAWEAMTNRQRRQWVHDNVPTILAATGIRFRVEDGDGVWGNPDDELMSGGLRRRTLAQTIDGSTLTTVG